MNDTEPAIAHEVSSNSGKEEENEEMADLTSILTSIKNSNSNDMEDRKRTNGDNSRTAKVQRIRYIQTHSDWSNQLNQGSVVSVEDVGDESVRLVHKRKGPAKVTNGSLLRHCKFSPEEVCTVNFVIFLSTIVHYIPLYVM